MKVIARRPGGVFLELLHDDRGRIVAPAAGYVGPELNVHSALLRGYWEEFPEPLDLAEASKRAYSTLKSAARG